MILPFLVGSLMYALAVMVAYSEKLKNTHYFYPLGLLIALVCNSIWLYITKAAPDSKTIYIYGLYWDSIIVLSYVLIPVVFMDVKLNPTLILGVLMIVAGMFITKMA